MLTSSVESGVHCNVTLLPTIVILAVEGNSSAVTFHVPSSLAVNSTVFTWPTVKISSVGPSNSGASLSA